MACFTASFVELHQVQKYDNCVFIVTKIAKNLNYQYLIVFFLILISFQEEKTEDRSPETEEALRFVFSSDCPLPTATCQLSFSTHEQQHPDASDRQKIPDMILQYIVSRV